MASQANLPKLYRDILKAAKRFPSIKRNKILEEIKAEFHANKVSLAVCNALPNGMLLNCNCAPCNVLLFQFQLLNLLFEPQAVQRNASSTTCFLSTDIITSQICFVVRWVLLVLIQLLLHADNAE